MSTSQRAVTSCVWGVKAGMVHVWVAGKTVCDPLTVTHGPYLSALEIRSLYIKRYINLAVFYFRTALGLAQLDTVRNSADGLVFCSHRRGIRPRHSTPSPTALVAN